MRLGLADSPESLERVLWSMDYGKILQLAHARGISNGRKYRWRHVAEDAGEVALIFDELSRRDFQWQSEPR